MAASAVSLFAKRLRKAFAAVGFGVRKTEDQDDSTVVQIISGSGAPAAALPNGSIYLRDDPVSVDTVIYVRAGGVWTAATIS